MNYVKPEVNLLANAVTSIQDPTNKAELDVQDIDLVDTASVNAYASDE